MLTQQTIDKMKNLKLHGMLQAWDNILEQNEHTSLSTIEALDLLVDYEFIFRKNKRQARLLKGANLRYSNISIESINKSNNIPREQYNLLIGNQWLINKQNIIITGPTGVGKTYLACGIGHNVCRCGSQAKYFKLSNLLEQLRIAQADGTYLNFMAKIAKNSCLIIDDWGAPVIPEPRRNNLLDIIDDFYNNGSIVITSQLPLEHWHDYIGEPLIADAILDRLVNNSITINLSGESMRKKA